jgi:SAM-dependent methyltransferase
VDDSHRTWADFGCSNGFIIEEISRLRTGAFDRIVGFDFDPPLIEQARARNIAGATFEMFNLNVVSPQAERFNLVTCFETLEHVGDMGSAVENLVAHLQPGGVLLIAVPIETGLPGSLKFFGRLAARRNPYEKFFADGRRIEYVLRLLTNRGLDGFRKPTSTGYGPHLGFDYRTLLQLIDQLYVQRGVLEGLEKRFINLRMNLIVTFRKARD